MTLAKSMLVGIPLYNFFNKSLFKRCRAYPEMGLSMMTGTKSDYIFHGVCAIIRQGNHMVRFDIFVAVGE